LGVEGKVQYQDCQSTIKIHSNQPQSDKQSTQ
jgi:hypothetical protein